MRLRFEHGVPALIAEPESAADPLVSLRQVLQQLSSATCTIAFLEDLPMRQLADLTALTWLGCGLYAPYEWSDARFEAFAAADALTPLRLGQRPALFHWLRAGLAQLEAPMPPRLLN